MENVYSLLIHIAFQQKVIISFNNRKNRNVNNKDAVKE